MHGNSHVGTFFWMLPSVSGCIKSQGPTSKAMTSNGGDGKWEASCIPVHYDILVSLLMRCPTTM